MNFMLSYGTEESCASTKTLASHYFLKDLVGRKTYNGHLNTDNIPFTLVRIVDKGSKAAFPKQ